MTKPIYTFVILSYNSEKYIYKCLESINSSIEDSGAYSEVFIVDNGSKDKAKEIINNFDFCDFIKFTFIELKENTGTTYSRNLALKAGTGEFVVIMDSDAYINA